MFDAKAYQKQRRDQRRAAGLCIQCGGPKDAGKARCLECLAKGLKDQKARQGKFAEEGRCRKCGEVTVEGRVHCAGCLAKHLVWGKSERERKRAAGRCYSCGIPCGESRCEKCKTKCNAATNESRRKLIEQGRCRDCGGEAVIDQVMTKRHTPGGLRTSKYCRDCFLKVMSRTVFGLGKFWVVLLEKLEASKWRCHYTGQELILGKNLSFDHLDPISRFPEKRRDHDNIVPCTLEVNLAKRQLTEAEFLALIQVIALNQKRLSSEFASEVVSTG
jgi:hypothetical protein